MRRIGVGQAGVVAVAAAAGLLAACGDGGGGDVQAGRPADFELSVDYLGQLVESARSQPYRFEASTSMIVFAEGDFSGYEDLTVVTGSADGQRVYQRTDLEPVLEALAEEEDRPLPVDLDEVDLSMEIVADEQTVYLRAPDYHVISDTARPGRTPPPLVEALSDLGDAWGRVDLTALGDELLPSDVTNALSTGENADPQQLLDLMTQASGVEEIGSEEIDGEPMTGLAADLNLLDMLEAQDLDTEAYLDQAASMPDAPEDAREILSSLHFPMEVWIDADGHVRRLTTDLGEAMRQVADELGEGDGPGAPLSWSVTVDFDDYGDPSIEIESPDPADAIDLTDTFRDMQLPG